MNMMYALLSDTVSRLPVSTLNIGNMSHKQDLREFLDFVSIFGTNMDNVWEQIVVNESRDTVLSQYPSRAHPSLIVLHAYRCQLPSVFAHLNRTWPYDTFSVPVMKNTAPAQKI